MTVRRHVRYPQLLLAGIACCLFISPVMAGQDVLPPDYPRSLERELAAVLSRLASAGDEVKALLEGAELYMQMADDLFTEEGQRQSAYEAGAAMAKRALHIDSRQAHAHFLYAATLGSAERLKGLANAGLVLNDIKRHLREALAIDPTHPQALQMMGGLYAELPWVLGGSEAEAESYLRRAIEADGRYTNAHLILARLLMKQRRFAEARLHLRAVIEVQQPHYPYSWMHLFKPEAERVLQALPPS